MFLNRVAGACVLLVAFGTGVSWSESGNAVGPTPALPDVVAIIFSESHSAPSAEVDGLLDELAKARHLHIQKLFKDDLAEAQGLGVKTTPTVFLNGTRVEGLDALRSLLRGKPPAPAWESLPVETLQLDFISSPSSGPPDAPVTLIEFTDFRCGFCQLHSQTLSQLTAAYPGKIRRIFKHYPMEGPGALLHVASIQALDQGKFWELHEALMAKPLEEGQPSVLERAQSVGIGADAFQQAISDPRARMLVQRDCAEGERLGIRATPTTFLNGRRLVGRQSLEDLKRYVDAILSGRHTTDAPVVAGSAAKTAGGGLLAVPALVNHAGVPQEETCCGGDFALPPRTRPGIGIGVTQPSWPRMNPEPK